MVTEPSSNQPYVCIEKDNITSHSERIAELEARANYKHERIEQIILDQKRMEDKIDHIAETVNQLQLQSVKDDTDIDKRVTSLETTVRVLKWVTSFLFGSGVIVLLLNLIK